VPSVEKAKLTEGDDIKIVNKAVELNVENSIRLISENEIVKRYIDEGKVKVVGANYNLETGRVEWLKIGKMLKKSF
ncbi:MAG: carbonic anhydrase, partial [Clostridium sp.]